MLSWPARGSAAARPDIAGDQSRQGPQPESAAPRPGYGPETHPGLQAGRHQAYRSPQPARAPAGRPRGQANRPAAGASAALSPGAPKWQAGEFQPGASFRSRRSDEQPHFAHRKAAAYVVEEDTWGAARRPGGGSRSRRQESKDRISSMSAPERYRWGITVRRRSHRASAGRQKTDHLQLGLPVVQGQGNGQRSHSHFAGVGPADTSMCAVSADASSAAARWPFPAAPRAATGYLLGVWQAGGGCPSTPTSACPNSRRIRTSGTPSDSTRSSVSSGRGSRPTRTRPVRAAGRT